MADFLMTSYFYPIKEDGTEKFFNGIYFDNPRTQDEIREVALFLRKVNFSTGMPFPEKQEQVPEGTITLRWMLERFYSNYKSDELVEKYYSKASKLKNIYMALARMWVIIRCDNLLDPNEKKKSIIILGESQQGYTPSNSFFNEHMVRKYLYFLSFMTNESGRINKSIILRYYDKYEYPYYYSELFPKLLTLCTSKSAITQKGAAPLLTFNFLWNRYKPYIDKTTQRYNDEKFLFICETIQNISRLQTTDERMYLLGIVGLIEMLVTHNPDSQRYNVEDSISKQYVRKIKYLLYQTDSSMDLERLEKELKLSYSIRSDIAHGNFTKSSKKNLKDLFTFYGMTEGGTGLDYCDESSALEKLNSNLSDYARIILRLYLEKEKELELIKEL